MSAPRLLPVGDGALSFELGSAWDPALAARVRALVRSLRLRPIAGVREAVPTVRALLVSFDPAVQTPETLGRELRARAAERERTEHPGALHVLPVRYGGENGEDLPAVAEACGLRPEGVVALHTGREYLALMLGFTPGFAYLGPLPGPLASLPRRPSPRPRVPAGSVGLAAGQTAVYPIASPGGWHLIGRTGVRLFDPRAEAPARIAAGDRVRFVATDEAPRETPVGDAEGTAGAPGLEVLEPGLLTTVQDLGRPGHRRHGVAAAGAMDPSALVAANRLVGNRPDDAGLECVGPGLALRFLVPTVFALAGADLGATLERSDLGRWEAPAGRAVRARPGNVLRLERRKDGLRAWLAFAGGLAVETVLGARATDLGGGFGGLRGRALRAGDRLPLGPSIGPATLDRWEAAPSAGPVTLRIVPGPQDDHFGPAAHAVLLEAEWEVDGASDRVGCRLRGPVVRHARASEIVSDGMLPGCVQVPPSGQPIVMGPDAPTTGGYPKIATVVTSDLPRLAQLVPGESRVRFRV